MEKKTFITIDPIELLQKLGVTWRTNKGVPIAGAVWFFDCEWNCKLPPCVTKLEKGWNAYYRDQDEDTNYE